MTLALFSIGVSLFSASLWLLFPFCLFLSIILFRFLSFSVSLRPSHFLRLPLTKRQLQFKLQALFFCLLSCMRLFLLWCMSGVFMHTNGIDMRDLDWIFTTFFMIYFFFQIVQSIKWLLWETSGISNHPFFRLNTTFTIVHHWNKSTFMQWMNWPEKKKHFI